MGRTACLDVEDLQWGGWSLIGVNQTSVNCLDNEITAVREACGTPAKPISK